MHQIKKSLVEAMIKEAILQVDSCRDRCARVLDSGGLPATFRQLRADVTHLGTSLVKCRSILSTMSDGIALLDDNCAVVPELWFLDLADMASFKGLHIDGAFVTWSDPGALTHAEANMPKAEDTVSIYRVRENDGDAPQWVELFAVSPRGDWIVRSPNQPPGHGRFEIPLCYLARIPFKQVTERPCDPPSDVPYAGELWRNIHNGTFAWIRDVSENGEVHYNGVTLEGINFLKNFFRVL